MNKSTDVRCSPPLPLPSRRGPFRLKLCLLLAGFFIMRLAHPNAESTRVQAVAIGTNDSISYIANRKILPGSVLSVLLRTSARMSPAAGPFMTDGPALYHQLPGFFSIGYHPALI
jgi:hypothetical protein